LLVESRRVAWIFWICGRFNLPSRLAAGIAFLWALLHALSEDASILFARPWWRRGGEDHQGQEGEPPQGAPDGDTLQDRCLSFPGNQNYARPEMRPVGAGDILIGAAIAYIQFKEWDMSLIDHALSDLSKFHAALNDILLCALLGSVQIWGRTRDCDWQPIEQSYWCDHDIDRLSVLRRQKPFTKRSGGRGDYPGAVVYIDLRMSRSQLEAIWSPQAANV
jgi:hypothetical protein